MDAAAKVRDLNFNYLSEGKGATVTARFGPDGITNGDPNRAGEGAEKAFQRIFVKGICTRTPKWRHSSSQIAQATGLCRAATSRSERR